MIPVTQTRTGLTGNCFEACLASLLDVPLHAIPDFGTDAAWLQRLQDYLLPRGYFYFQLDPGDPMLKSVFAFGSTWHTIEGISPNGIAHAVVGLNGKMVHDPDPRAVGIKKVECFGFLGVRL